MAILMCDGTLSVEYVNGFCCNYPGTNQNHYDMLVAAPVPGQWVRQNLYKLFPYRQIALPCPPAGCGGGGGTVNTGCCGGIAIPTTLHATIAGVPGSTPLHYDGTQYWLGGSVALPCGDALKLRLVCGSGGIFVLQGSCDGGTTWFSFVLQITSSCSPLALQYAAQLGGACTHCNGQVLNATVTA
jgi:hypothetical protein